MTTSELPRVCFIRVGDNASKLNQICSLVHRHFLKNERILIPVPSQEAAAYIDQLLWKMPEESFLPHAIVNIPCQERIVITTTTLSNINQAAIIINLLPALHVNPAPAHCIYELLDLTSAEKEAASRKKEAAYRAAGYLVGEVVT
jgi:DNA polymerase IIIc chi subunit